VKFKVPSVHAKAIALVGLSLQESWNVPNAELIMYCFAHQSQQMAFVFTFALSLWVFTGLPRKIFLLNVKELM
jgi:hypothetical protein